MAVGRDLVGKNNHVIAVIGDGAMTAGQAYEAINNAGYMDANFIIVLNDNRQVSLPTTTPDGSTMPVGALSQCLTRLQTNRKFHQRPQVAKGVTKKLGDRTHEIAAKMDSNMTRMLDGEGASIFEDLGLNYVGPVDGHNLEDLVYVFNTIKSMPNPGPVLIHIVTEKGKGYHPAEIAADKMHGIVLCVKKYGNKTLANVDFIGVVKFDTQSGKQVKNKAKALSYTQYFADSLVAEAKIDKKIVAIHAAMGGGTGLNTFQKHFPTRCFDVGIAEQHAVTFAAGLATQGLKPFCAIYSSFRRDILNMEHKFTKLRRPVLAQQILQQWLCR